VSSPLSTSSGDLIADRRFNLAAALAADGDHAAAAEVLEQALERAPAWAEGWLMLGEWRQRLGNEPAAIAAYERAAARDTAGRLGADLRLAALGISPAPEAMPAPYVRTLFDDYAPRFDHALVERLGYNAPERLAESLAELGDRRFASALDLGCGTGLMGAAIHARVDHLTGFDLSEGMLRLAARRGVYDRLVAGDVVELMAGEPENGFDLVLAADLLPYLGSLGPLFAAVARVLSPGGAFAFSAERHDGEGFVLGEALRYRHAPALVGEVVEAAGLTLLGLEPVSLRRERGVPVPGLVALAVRPADIVPLEPRPAGPAGGGPLPHAAWSKGRRNRSAGLPRGKNKGAVSSACPFPNAARRFARAHRGG
jgi:predicted TPR repeat methyltransferase